MSDSYDTLSDPSMLRLMRSLCPKKGDKGITEIRIESGGRSVSLTAETREKINARLRALKGSQ